MADILIKAKIKVNRIVFQAKDSDFKILSVEPVIVEEGDIETHSYYNTFTIKGNAPSINYGDTYSIIAKEIQDEKWGKQYELIYIGTPMRLDDVNSQHIFLSKILTESQYEALYNTLDNPFEAIMNEDIERLTKVKGIGVKTATRIIDKYKNTIDYSEALVELDNYGLTTRMIEKLVENYGSPNLVVQKIKENPYLLADEIDGIGFKKADAIALNSGIDRNSPFRIQSFIESFLENKAMEGFTYYDANGEHGVMGAIIENLGCIDTEILKETIYKMKEKNILWWNSNKEYFALKKYFNLEKKIAYELTRIKNCENSFVYDDWEKVIEETELMQGWKFTEQQKDGIKTALSSQVVMVTGLGGTGKTSIVSGMLEVLSKRYGYSFAQCALSGRAGSRMAEVTGEEGYTVHRLLKYNPNLRGFEYDESNKLPYDIIIIDELSMVGGDLFLSLIKAIENGSKLIMLCDTGQLESIGMGNIAKDIIDSGVISTVRLTQIHRQAQKSAIVTESLKMRESKQIIEQGFTGIEIRGELQDLLLDIVDDKEYVSYNIIKHFKEELASVSSILDLQVVVPMKSRGNTCTFKLNEKMQGIYNPYSMSKKEVQVAYTKDLKYVLREGDKVLNNKNNYKTVNTDGIKTPVYNGNVGIIEEIDLIEDVMIVNFQSIGRVIIPLSNWKNLELAYAITCHKSQGSEYDRVIVGVDYSAYTLLSREWIYTAITRAKKYCILVAENSALRYGTKQSKVIKKQTFLKDFLVFIEQDINLETNI